MAEWDKSRLKALIAELGALRSELVHLETAACALLEGISPTYVESALNLLHYVALRRHDLRNLQDRLTDLGLSSLGRAEGCVLANLDAVLQILQHLVDQPKQPGRQPVHQLNFTTGKAMLDAHAQALLGPNPDRGPVRILVTMPGEAANNYDLVRDLLKGGMNCMRINCAHDNQATWAGMIAHLRRAELELEKKCRVLMDLPGPKLRTGALEPGPKVVKCRPKRDCFGRVLAPARIWLTPAEQPQTAPLPAEACLPVPGEWLAQLGPGERIRFRDTRGASRSLTVGQAVDSGRWAEVSKTSYFATGTVLRLWSPGNRGHKSDCQVGDVPPLTLPIIAKPGETLILTRDSSPGRPGIRDEQGVIQCPARIGCTLPQVFDAVRPGERVWFDDGRIGGRIRKANQEELDVLITQASTKGSKLGADKGINLPDTALRLPALTDQDVEILQFIASHADLVGLSFIHEPADVTEIQKQLVKHGGQELGIVLKIETQRAFEQLPQLLLAAMRGPCVGVMIARGDLAVECGYERLAELQEEILWICEAAHVPVIWATQVLESLAKEGTPSRAEITDAAMGERAECVMLNKGPHIVRAVHVLDDILKRMRGHQHKKRPMLRQLSLAGRFPVEAIHA
jgi:pyruvate kinase